MKFEDTPSHVPNPPLMKILQTFALSAIALAGTLAGAAPGDTAYLFTYFTGNARTACTSPGALMATSGRRSTAEKSCLTSTIGKEKLHARSLCRPRTRRHLPHGVDSGWWENNIGYASTRDFITWSEPRKLR